MVKLILFRGYTLCTMQSYYSVSTMAQESMISISYQRVTSLFVWRWYSQTATLNNVTNIRIVVVDRWAILLLEHFDIEIQHWLFPLADCYQQISENNRLDRHRGIRTYWRLLLPPILFSMSAYCLLLETVQWYEWQLYRHGDHKSDCICLFSYQLFVRLDILYITWIHSLEDRDESKDEGLSPSPICSWRSVS